MEKGNLTRERILAAALHLASVEGVTGINLAPLARSAGLSKSGLFAHFTSKEELQRQVLRYAASEFRRAVVVPALSEKTSLARLRSLLSLWLDWPQRSGLPGGCVFFSAAAELDDLSSPIRAMVQESYAQLLQLIARLVREGTEAGEFVPEADPEQLAFEILGVYMAHHVVKRLLGEPRAEMRALDSVNALLARHAA